MTKPQIRETPGAVTPRASFFVTTSGVNHCAKAYIKYTFLYISRF